MAQLVPGDIVDGRFEVEICAGTGGMGRVYRCRDLCCAGTVALKVMAVYGEAHRERFAREARVLASLKHPGIVGYVAHGFVSFEEPYLAMEWVDGESLGLRICGEPLGVHETLALMQQLCAALSEAHAHGVVHRDLKPANILLQGGDLGRPRILDFGLARSADTNQAITRTGALLGTPAYMAPEQARRTDELDPRADVYALGCLLFECLAGQPAFRGPNVVAVLCKVLLEEPPELSDLRPDVPAGLSQLIARMLAKDPAARPRDAAAVLDALAEVFAVPASSGPPKSGIGRAEQRYLSVVLAGCPGESIEQPGTVQVGAQRVLAVLQKAVDSYDADISHLVDSTVMLTLRGKGSATDRAVRAGRCALAMRDLLPHLPVVMATRRGMFREHRPVGDVIDEAARLLAIAALGAPSTQDGGPVLLDAISASLLDQRFEVRRTGECDQLVAFRAGAVEPRKLLGRSTPCVGRTRELAMLRAVWEECVDERLARPVIVTGPAGIGKTRLIREWIAELSSFGKVRNVRVVRADAMGTGSSFGVLGRLVRDLAHATARDAPETVRDKVRGLVDQHVAAADQARVAVFLAEMLGISSPSPESTTERAARSSAVLRGDQIRRSFQDLVRGMASREPVLLVVEDLQWADTPSVELLDETLRNLSNLPLCVVGLARPELEARFPRVWGDRALTSFSLGPLRFRAAVQLVCAALEGIETARAEHIARRSGGSPFFLEELVRAEAEERSERVPETLLAVVQARIDELNLTLRRVLRAASVYGDAFETAGVEAMLAEDAADLPFHLEALVAREVVVAASSAPDGEAFVFAQGMWREAAYDTLTEQDRVIGHALAGDFLARQRPAAAHCIAEHFARGQRPLAAAPWFARAAHQALEGGDYKAALQCVDESLRCGLSAGAGELMLVRAEAHKWRGENQAALAAACDAVRLAEVGSATFYRAQGELASSAGKLGQVATLTSVAENLLAATDGVGEAGVAEAMAQARCVTQLVLSGQLAAADALLDRLTRTSPDASVAGWVFEARAVRAGSGGDPAGRVAMAGHAADAFRAVGDDRNACLQLTSVGFALNEIGDYPAAERALRDAAAIAERMGLENALSTARAQLGRALVRMGCRDQASTTLEAAIAALGPQGNQRLEGVARAYLAWSLHDAGAAGAKAEAERAVAVLASAPTLRASAAAVLSQILLKDGQIERACEVAEEALRALEQVGSAPMDEGLIFAAAAESLLARGENLAAADVAKRGEARLRARADQIRDPVQRATFCAIPEHARTLALHAQLAPSLCAGAEAQSTA
jgi:tetratricopeptide (TPR) repeat protein/predicted Ser/Thr protein kinase